MSFGICLVGYLILIVGLGLGANLLNVPAQWIGVGALCLIGIAIVHGVSSTRQKDLPSYLIGACGSLDCVAAAEVSMLVITRGGSATPSETVDATLPRCALRARRSAA